MRRLAASPMLFLLLLVASTLHAQPFDDHGHSDLWASAGIGFGGYEHEEFVTPFALQGGITIRKGHLSLTGRHAYASQVFGDRVSDVALLAGAFLPLGRVALVPSVGVSRVWGSTDNGLLQDGADWGPHSGFAYELQMLLTDAPWIGITFYGNENRSGDFWGVAACLRLGSFR